MGRRAGGGGGGNAWNDFQCAHGGQGLSRGEMSAMYHAAAAPAAPSSGGYAMRASSAWNEFQHEYGGRGLSRDDLRSLYAHQKGDAPTAAKVAGAAKTWNEFQHEYAGTGLSREQVAHLYHGQKQAQHTQQAPPATDLQPKHQPSRYFESLSQKPYQFGAPSQLSQAQPKPQNPFLSPFQYPAPNHQPKSSTGFIFGAKAEPEDPRGSPFGVATGFTFGSAPAFSFAAKPEPRESQQRPQGFTFANYVPGAFGVAVHAQPSAHPTQTSSTFAAPTPTFGFVVPPTKTEVSSEAFSYYESHENLVYMPFSVDSRGRERSPEELAFKYYRRRQAKNKSVGSARAVIVSAASRDRPTGGSSTVGEQKEVKKKLALSTVLEDEEEEDGRHSIRVTKAEAHPQFKCERTKRVENPSNNGVEEQVSTATEVAYEEEEEEEGGRREDEEVKAAEQETVGGKGKTKIVAIDLHCDGQKDEQVEEEKVKVDSSSANRSISAQSFHQKTVAVESKLDDQTSSTRSHTSSLVLSLVFTDGGSPPIGDGLTGRTVIASSASGDTRVAVKIVPSVHSKRTIARVTKETEALSQLPGHDHVAQFHGLVWLDEKKKCAVVTELITDSKNLVARLYGTSSGPAIAERRKYQVILQLLDAINHIHQHGMPHRDVTPTHVLISTNKDGLESVKLIDFGLPTLKNAASFAASKSGVTGFNPSYASPELLGGQIARDDVGAWKKSDMFSFAVVMMEILLEEQPWEGELPVFFMKAVAEEGERPFEVDELLIHGHKSRALEQIVAQAWHQDPEKRPTASVLREMLVKVFLANDVDDKSERPPPPHEPTKESIAME